MIPDIAMCFGGKHQAKILKAEKLPWGQVVALFSATPPETDDKASEGWYACAEFNPLYRDGENLIGRSALTLDYDRITKADVPKIVGALEDYAFIAYTTFSHAADAPRLRVIVPLDRLATPEEFQAVSRRVASWAGIELASRESHAPGQMMYLPARKPGAKYKVMVGKNGDPICVDEILATYDDWTDRLSWPRRKEHDELSKDEIPPAPDTKPGVVGDFCRAFRIGDAIERFDLPYTPVSDGRYTFTHGSRPEGAVEYDGGLKLHSHHDSDPAHGQHNAFDLVRLHRYGSLDAAVPPETPVTERPSYQAMCKLALEQPEVRTAQAEADFEEVTVIPPKPEGTLVLKDGFERFVVIPAAEFTGGPPLTWRIADVLPDAELAVIYGESGSGKSFLALDMACAITRGMKWRSHDVEPGTVIYVAAEGASGFRARLQAYARANGIDMSQMPAVIADAPNFLQPKEIIAAEAQILKYGKPALIIVDTLSASAPGGNENSGEDMGLVISHAKRLHKSTGAMVVLIHHSGKDAAKGARGWSGLKAAADAEYEVTRNGDFRAMRISKMKDGQDGMAYGFKLKVVPLDLEQSSCVIEHVDTPVPEKKKARPEVPSGMKAKLVWKVIHEMISEGESIDREELMDELADQYEDLFPRTDAAKKSNKQVVDRMVVDGWLRSVGGGRLSYSRLKVGDDADE